MSAMVGKLDDISYRLGQLTAGIENVAQSIEANRKLADCRHLDNQARLSTIEKTLAPLNETVNKISPIVDGIQITRWKMAGAISVGSLFLAGLGWLLTMIAGKVTSWALSLIK